MITARPAARARSEPRPAAPEVPEACPSRHSRRQWRRRKMREQLIIAVVLALLLIITVALLALQWLDIAATVTSSLGATLTGGAPT